MKILVFLAALLVAAPVFAASSYIEFTDTLVSPLNNWSYVQTMTPNPLLTVTIADNYSHTVAVPTTQPVPFDFALTYNGSGTCYVRLMGNTTKASWVQYPVAQNTTFERGLHPNVVYYNYSGCQ